MKRPKVNGGSSDRPKTKAQVDRRRERNRILARRTRLRKKFFFESLQIQVRATFFFCFLLSLVTGESREGMASYERRIGAFGNAHKIEGERAEE